MNVWSASDGGSSGSKKEDAVVALDGDAPDLLAPVLVVAGPARYHRSALATGHAPLLVFEITVNLGVE
jgi:hypothetical protein